MYDLFEIGEENKIKKIKGNSISNKSELKSLARQLNRDINYLEAIEMFPNENEICSFVSKGMSDAGSFLYAINKKLGVIEELTICTWTISKNNIKRLLDYVDEGKVLKLNFLINDGMLNTNSTKPIYAFMRLEFDQRKDKINYSVVNSHAKIQMYKVAKKYLTISGSGNWSENPRIENYIIIGGKNSYDFNCKWVNDIINER